MKNLSCLQHALWVLLMSVLVSTVYAHPPIGVAVDEKGNLYFFLMAVSDCLNSRQTAPFTASRLSLMLLMA